MKNIRISLFENCLFLVVKISLYLNRGVFVMAVYVLSRNMKNIRISLFENFRFLVVKFSIYLNRRVFVMAVCK